MTPLPCPCGRGMRAVLPDFAGNPVRLADVCKTCSGEAFGPSGHGAIVDPADLAAMPGPMLDAAKAHAADILSLPASAPPRTLPVTPAERHLAAILRSFQAWNTHPDAGTPDDNDDAVSLMLDLGEWLQEQGMLNDDEPGFTPAGRDLLARAEAEERTPANVLRAMLASYSAAVIELRAELWRGPTWPPLFARQLDVLDHAITTLHNALGAYLAGSPRAEESLMSLGRLIRGDYTARLAGTTPIDAPPAKEPR